MHETLRGPRNAPESRAAPTSLPSDVHCSAQVVRSLAVPSPSPLSARLPTTFSAGPGRRTARVAPIFVDATFPLEGPAVDDRKHQPQHEHDTELHQPRATFTQRVGSFMIKNVRPNFD